VAVTGFVSVSLLMRVSGIVLIGGTERMGAGVGGEDDAMGLVIVPVATGVAVVDTGGLFIGAAVSAGTRACRTVAAARTGPAPVAPTNIPNVRDNRNAATRSTRWFVGRNNFLSTYISSG